MSSKGTTEEEVARAFAKDLIGDISISDAHILGLRRFHRGDSTVAPSGSAGGPGLVGNADCFPQY
jgi:hypothetical protein